MAYLVDGKVINACTNPLYLLGIIRQNSAIKGLSKLLVSYHDEFRQYEVFTTSFPFMYLRKSVV